MPEIPAAPAPIEHHKKRSKSFDWWGLVKVGTPIAMVALTWIGSVELRLGDRTSMDRQFRAMEAQIESLRADVSTANARLRDVSKRSETIETLITPLIIEFRVEQALRQKAHLTPPLPMKSAMNESQMRKDAESWTRSQLPKAEQQSLPAASASPIEK